MSRASSRRSSMLVPKCRCEGNRLGQNLGKSASGRRDHEVVPLDAARVPIRRRRITSASSFQFHPRPWPAPRRRHQVADPCRCWKERRSSPRVPRGRPRPLARGRAAVHGQGHPLVLTSDTSDEVWEVGLRPRQGHGGHSHRYMTSALPGIDWLLLRCCWPCVCPRGDLNPHALSRALAPQASASTYSATRTGYRRMPGRRMHYSNSAPGGAARRRLVPGPGAPPALLVPGAGDARMASWPSNTDPTAR